MSKTGHISVLVPAVIIKKSPQLLSLNVKIILHYSFSFFICHFHRPIFQNSVSGLQNTHWSREQVGDIIILQGSSLV